MDCLLLRLSYIKKNLFRYSELRIFHTFREAVTSFQCTVKSTNDIRGLTDSPSSFFFLTRWVGGWNSISWRRLIPHESGHPLGQLAFFAKDCREDAPLRENWLISPGNNCAACIFVLFCFSYPASVELLCLFYRFTVELGYICKKLGWVCNENVLVTKRVSDIIYLCKRFYRSRGLAYIQVLLYFFYKLSLSPYSIITFFGDGYMRYRSGHHHPHHHHHRRHRHPLFNPSLDGSTIGPVSTRCFSTGNQE